MLSLQNTKQVIVGEYYSGTNALTGLIDTQGFSEVLVSVWMGTTADTTQANLSACKLSDCDTSNGTFTDITASIGAASGGAWDFPYGNSSSSTIIRYHVNMLGSYERYLKVTVDPITSNQVMVWAQLGRAKEMPNSTTKEGVTAHINLPG